MTTILVTGAHGFLGMAVVERLLTKEGNLVIGVDRPPQGDNAIYQMKRERMTHMVKQGAGEYRFVPCDLRNAEEVYYLIGQNNPDYVIHFAGQYAVMHNTKHATSFLENNCLAFGHLLEACRVFSVKKIVYASSTCVDGEYPTNYYGITKRFNELLATHYERQFQLKTVGIRYCTIYGPWVRPDMQLYQLIDSSFTGRAIRHPRTAGVGSMVYVWDAVECTLRFLNFPVTGIYTLCSDETRSLYDVDDAIQQLGYGPVNWVGEEPGDHVTPYKPDQSHLHAAISYAPNTPFAYGLQTTIDWYKEQKGAQKK